MEHFVTLFDVRFLPQGLCLHDSLGRHVRPFHLWVVCMDEATEAALRVLDLPHVSLIPLREVETDALRAVKQGRTIAEYCWTLTPFLAGIVLDRASNASRVTYLDADLFFFDRPAPFFEELERSRRHVLITEHGYAPEYDASESSGRFCVQFLCVTDSAPARRVTGWWQERCLEWCFARAEDGKFGDQKYLDAWPELFADAVHVLSQTDRTLAPWNVDHVAARGALAPVFYHYHGLRLHRGRRATLFSGYRVGSAGAELYARYLAALAHALDTLEGSGVRVPYFDRPGGAVGMLRRLKRRVLGREREAALPTEPLSLP